MARYVVKAYEKPPKKKGRVFMLKLRPVRGKEVKIILNHIEVKEDEKHMYTNKMVNFGKVCLGGAVRVCVLKRL